MTVRAPRRTWPAETAARLMSTCDTARVDGMGIGVLAALTGQLGRPVLERWLGAVRDGAAHAGAFGIGQAGVAAGLAAAAAAEPRLAAPAEAARRGVVRWACSRDWPPDRLRWPDYDLLGGQAGILLAVVGSGHRAPAELARMADHLAALSGDGLAGLRIDGYAEDPVRGWNQGAINLGLGHGVPGVVAALTAAHRVLGPRPNLLTALRHGTDFLRRYSTVDNEGAVVWPACDRSGARDSATSRQAWCYGTPGVAWVLWDAGLVLADARLRSFAEDAMTSLCRVWDPDRYLYGDTPADVLGICHGGAGVLAVADAFARHAGLPEAARLRAELTDWLLRRADAIDDLATTNMTLLDGAAGVLCVLLTAAGGRRDWLTVLALR